MMMGRSCFYTNSRDYTSYCAKFVDQEIISKKKNLFFIVSFKENFPFRDCKIKS